MPTGVYYRSKEDRAILRERIKQTGCYRYWLGKKRPTPSKETRKKLSEANKGNVPWMKGKKHTEETKRKMSIALTGRVASQETRNKISKALTGKKFSKERVEKMSKRMTGKPRFDLRGKNHPQWDGGRPFKRESINNLVEYKEWRKAVYERDNYTCVECGYNKGHILVADHIKQLAIILKENDIDSIEKALKCKEIWDVNNGRTLCEDCHKKTPTYCRKLKNLTYEPTSNI